MNTIWQPDLSNAGRSKYQALAAALRKAIAEGVLEKGSKLPPVRDLAYRTNVTPGTVARAYSLLVEEGLLVAGVGRGTFVADRQLRSAPVSEWPEAVILRRPVLPEAGQSELLHAAMVAVEKGATAGWWGEYPSRNSDLPLRKALQGWLEDLPVGQFSVEDIVMTNGAQSAVLAVLQTVLSGPEPVVLVESQSYPGFRRAAELCRARVIGIDADEQGPIVAQVEAAARDHAAQIFLTSAAVNNPTLRTTSGQRRREIAAVAQRYGMHVLDDDCYKLTPANEESYRSLLPELGWYVSSLSKSLSPALRLGWAIAPSARSIELARSVAYGCFGVSRPVTELAQALLRDPKLPVVLADIRRALAERVQLAVNHLGGYDVTWHRDVPFVWIALPSGWRANRFARLAEAQGVFLKSSEDFVLREMRAPHCVRLAIHGLIASECFEDAMTKVRVLLDNPQEEISV